MSIFVGNNYSIFIENGIPTLAIAEIETYSYHVLLLSSRISEVLILLASVLPKVFST
jgi:hypothetical protein